jgi:hypothetical protein
MQHSEEFEPIIVAIAVRTSGRKVLNEVTRQLMPKTHNLNHSSETPWWFS